MKAVREDEIAAEAMGINALRIKTFTFAFSAFFQGVAGGLLAHLITTISPSLFTFMFTFNLLIIIVIGGLGSTTGSVIAAILITWGGEALRVFEETFKFLRVPICRNSWDEDGFILINSYHGNAICKKRHNGPI